MHSSTLPPTDPAAALVRPPAAAPFIRCLARLLVPVALIALAATPGRAQLETEGAAEDGVASRDDAPLVYIDCRRCDMSHFRREVTFVNHVRDPNLAHVHILITDEATGSGGRRFRLDFTGRESFGGVSNELAYVSQQSNSSTEERDGLTEILKLGLVPYVAQTSLASRLRLSFDEAERAEAAPQNDPWNNWTFELYGGGNFNLESSQSSWSARYGFYANRVTEEWKVRLRPYFNNNARTIRRTDEPDIRSEHHRHGFDSYLIKSVGDHMGVGFFVNYITTTVDNIDHRVQTTPAVEYNVYPYSEASRRQITFTYRIGYEGVRYLQETIYERTQEQLANHSLSSNVQIRQPWGSISAGMTGSSYLHDTQYHRLTFNGNVSFRIGRGLSLNLGGNYQRINDQLALPRGDASLEDILLQRRRLATSYRGRGNIGLSYTFGAIFTNVVNPRL